MFFIELLVAYFSIFPATHLSDVPSYAYQPKMSDMTFNNNQIIIEFVDSFSKHLEQHDTLRKLFEQTIEATKRLDFYDSRVESASRFSHPDPSEAADSLVKSLLPVSHILTPHILAGETSRSVAHLLHEKGILTAENAEELSRKLSASFLKASLSYGPSPTEQQYLKAIDDGFQDFVDPFNILDSQAVERMVINFNQQLLSLKE